MGGFWKKYNFHAKETTMLLLCFVLLFGSFTSFSFMFTIVSFAEDEVKITTLEEFNNIRDQLDGNYRLGANIHINNFKQWESFGTDEQPFDGSFHGNGYTITVDHSSLSANEIDTI